MRILKLLIFLSIAQSASGQRIIDSKIRLSVSFGIVSPIGDKLYTNGDYVAASFLNNFKSNNAVGADASYKFNKIFLANFKFAQVNFSNWSNSSSTRYNETDFYIISLCPQLGLTTPFQETGLWSKLNISGLVGPVFSTYKQNHHPGVVDSKGTGIAANVEADYLISNYVFVGLSYAITEQNVSANQFESDNIAFSSINLHVGLRVKFNKRFKYKSQW